MFELVVEGAVNNSSETRQAIFRALHKELRLTKDEAQGVIDSLPHTLVLADSDEDLAFYYQVLSIAGARVVLVCREQNMPSEIFDDEVTEAADLTLQAVERGEILEDVLDDGPAADDVGDEQFSAGVDADTDVPRSVAMKGLAGIVAVTFLGLSTLLVQRYTAEDVVAGERLTTPGILAAAPQGPAESAPGQSAAGPRAEAPALFSAAETIGARLVEATLSVADAESGVLTLGWRATAAEQGDARTDLGAPEVIRRFELSGMPLSAGTDGALHGEGTARVFVEGPGGAKRVIAKAYVTASRLGDGYELTFKLQRGASLENRNRDDFIRYVSEQDDFMIALTGSVLLNAAAHQG